jgi:hypothetical protein
MYVQEEHEKLPKMAAKYIPWLMYSVLQSLAVELDFNRLTFQLPKSMYISHTTYFQGTLHAAVNLNG